MQITLSPVRSDDTLTASRSGDSLTLNGVLHDFSRLAEGEALSQAAIGSPWIIGEVRRQKGLLQIALLLPHGGSAPDETRFPRPLLLTGDGAVALPPHDRLPEAVCPDEEAPAPQAGSAAVQGGGKAVTTVLSSPEVDRTTQP